jgi:hypothetical protein
MELVRAADRWQSPATLPVWAHDQRRHGSTQVVHAANMQWKDGATTGLCKTNTRQAADVGCSGCGQKKVGYECAWKGREQATSARDVDLDVTTKNRQRRAMSVNVTAIVDTDDKPGSTGLAPMGTCADP